MKYTGIRAVAFNTPRRIMQPHIARYQFVTRTISHADLVLDIACGTGYGVSVLKSAGYKHVFGVDLDWSAVNYSKAHFHDVFGIDFIQADGNKIPIADDAFDLVTCFETFEHMLDSRHFITELCRLVRPTGTLVISVPNAPIWAPFSKPPNLNLDYIKSGLGHKHDFRAKEFLDFLSEYFDEVLPFGQDFRRASIFGKVARQLERALILVKYRAARSAIARRLASPFLEEVLPQTDITFRDAQWKVEQWGDFNYEPLFCVAVCRNKTITG